MAVKECENGILRYTYSENHGAEGLAVRIEFYSFLAGEPKLNVMVLTRAEARELARELMTRGTEDGS